MALRGKGKNDTPATGARTVTPDVAAVDGDYCLIWTISDSDTSVAPTWPSGFVEDTLSPITISALDLQRLRWAWKVASGEPGTWTVTAATDGFIVGCAIFSGRDTVAPVHQISARADTTTRASPWTATSSAFAGATTIDGCDLVFLQADNCTPGGNVAHTAPTNFTLRMEHASADFHNGALSVWENVAVGQTGDYAGVGTKAATNSNLAIVSVALAPAGGAPPISVNRSRKLATQQRMVA